MSVDRGTVESVVNQTFFNNSLKLIPFNAPIVGSVKKMASPENKNRFSILLQLPNSIIKKRHS